MSERPLLMIPGPIEVSESVRAAAAEAPRSHVAPDFIEAFGASLEAMRKVWLAADSAQPFIVAGSGTLAMEMAAWNVVAPGERVVVVNTGYFSDRAEEMLRRRGAEVAPVNAEPGHVPSMDEVRSAVVAGPTRALFATHVDTSTGVRVDARGLCQLARDHDLITVFDGVCATAGEEFQMQAWDADVYLTASQKAIGLPAGLALMVASARAMEQRNQLNASPPMALDWLQWLPIMEAYEARRPAYFATPATTLVWALRAGLHEILGAGDDHTAAVGHRVTTHATVAERCRRAWRGMGLELVPATDEVAANTLSAIRYPRGVGPGLVPAIKKRGVVVAPGLHPKLKDQYFRVGHMGDVVTRAADMDRCITAVGDAVEAALKTL